MKKTYIILALIIVAIVAYYTVSIDDKSVVENGSQTEQTVTYNKADVGLEFTYRTGPTGYVLDERIPADIGEELERYIILHRAEDTKNAPPVGGEGAPVITIAVLNNVDKQLPRQWALDNVQYSNINLITGTTTEAVVGGANAIRYMADGLYASENVVVAHGDNVYVITGQFLNADSDLRREFAPLVDSIRFIPEPGQE